MDFKRCSRGLWDTTVPGITFDQTGVSNYAKMFDELCSQFPRGEKGKEDWKRIISKIKNDGKNKRYDCVIGVSGGTDSSFLLHLAKKKYGLRPLAVNLDNGWSSEIAVKNIKKVTKALNIDLETYVIDYEEVKAVLRAFLKATLPWVDGPTDMAIKAALYDAANREGIKYILNGSDFRSEGKQPSEWTYGDSRLFKSVLNKFEKVKLKSYPVKTLLEVFYLASVKGIHFYRPFYYLDYQKRSAQELLIKEYDWEYYGGHHHENIFTKFIIGYWLPQKFKIDKRIITLSAQILSGEITREEGLELLSRPPYDHDQMERDREYVVKKLELSPAEYQQIWDSPNKYYWDYPNYLPMIQKFSYFVRPLSKLVLKTTPPIFQERTSRD